MTGRFGPGESETFISRPRAASRSRRWRDGDNFALASINKTADMIFPQRQRGAHLALVARSVVDASNAAAMAAMMVEHLLDDVRLHPEVGHPRCNASPDVVQHPLTNAGALIEIALAVDPAREPSRAMHTEQVITADH